MDKILILPTAQTRFSGQWYSLQKGQAGYYYGARLSFYVLPLHNAEFNGMYCPVVRLDRESGQDVDKEPSLQLFLQATAAISGRFGTPASDDYRRALSAASTYDVRGGRVVTVTTDVDAPGFGYTKTRYSERNLRVRDVLTRLVELVDDSTGLIDWSQRFPAMPQGALWKPGDVADDPKDGYTVTDQVTGEQVYCKYELPTPVNFSRDFPRDASAQSLALRDRWLNAGEPVIVVPGPTPNPRFLTTKEAQTKDISQMSFPDWVVLDQEPGSLKSDGDTDAAIWENVKELLVRHQQAHEDALNGVYTPSPLEEGDLFPTSGGDKLVNPV